MTRWSIQFATGGKRRGTKAVKPWQLVGFPGPNGGESRGIVDLLAIRRDHSSRAHDVFRPGDLFEIIVVQIKGGRAPWPSAEDIRRLRSVRRYYHAKCIVLADWVKGKSPNLYVLGRDWDKKDAEAVFGKGSRLARKRKRAGDRPRSTPLATGQQSS
jgi:hypothetical protein